MNFSDAVAEEGWHELGASIVTARRNAPTPQKAVTEIGVAYVCFARANPALYRIMYDAACDRESMPGHGKAEEGSTGWTQVAEAIIESGNVMNEPRDLELATISAWCTAHGVAEMAGFREFDELKRELGGEEAFVRGRVEPCGRLRLASSLTPLAERFRYPVRAVADWISPPWSRLFSPERRARGRRIRPPMSASDRGHRYRPL